MAKVRRKKAALYVRVSTDSQDLDHQEQDLRDELGRRGWELAGVYREVASGSSWARRAQLGRLRHDAAMNRFQAVLVWSISRLGRSTVEVLRIAQELHSRGVGLVSLKEPALDLTSSMGRFVLTVWAAISELELEQIRERTRSGLEGARRRGRRLGRPPKVTPAQVRSLVAMYPRRGGIARAARMLGISPRHVSRLLRRDERDKNGPR